MPSRALLLTTALVLPLASAWAQYKVVRPDGSVTYTDRPPVTDSNARITPMGRSAQSGTASLEAALPAELRQAMQRYPVTLYTSADCAPCDAGRRLLQQRGIPYGERRVSSDEETLALEKVSGGRTVPALTIGAQQLRGLSESDWGSYLDAAGYPRESKLPRTWPAAQVLPLIERPAPGAAPRQAANNAPPVDPRPDDMQVLPAPGAIRF